MIIQCKLCEKSFQVPDSAITEQGRLVQCGSCNNKWTQYPIKLQKEENIKPINLEKEIINKPLSKENNIKKIIKRKPSRKKKKIDSYSPEYLAKKHGIKIIDPSKSSNEQLSINQRKKNIGYGFYNYLFTFIILTITVVGTLHLTREIIDLNYPYLTNYINYLFESLDYIKIIISNIFLEY
jgi:predicted Zn finger-like uncharacterized protein